MRKPRTRGHKGPTSRDGGGFVALPWSVLDCAAYARLSYPARCLLLEFARQFVGDNNGRLLASLAHLRKRGWNSADVITRAKRELLAGHFIFETVMGQRPNRASWYALTWYALDRHPGYDQGVERLFRRGAYRDGEPLKNAPLRPAGGIEQRAIAPAGGVEGVRLVPAPGAMRDISALGLDRETETI
jgi:hypothetical protein